jgi:23S rRNA pseudouridine2605 synthase
VSAPRRPGGGDKRPGRPAKPGARRPRPATSDGDRPARTRKDGGPATLQPEGKTRRVRKDGSVASGTREARVARAEGLATPAPEKPVRARTKSSTVRQETKDRTGVGPRGARVGPAGERRSSSQERPARTRPQIDAKPPRVRADGSVATRGGERATKEPQRIAKLLARAGVASRREIERMIAEGRIAIEGKILDTPATVLKSLHGVTVDGKPVEAPEAARLFLFHKPTGFLTTERDPRGRPTIYDRLPEGLPRLVPVGRLDMNTEGLLLMTTDGGLKRQLELPSSGVPRIYRARAYGEVSQDQLEALIEGVEIDGIRYGQIDANLERRTGRNVWIEMRLTEGKNREVRRVLEYLGLQVSRLIRVAYGPFVLGELPAGEIGEVKQHELVEFRKTLR